MDKKRWVVSTDLSTVHLSFLWITPARLLKNAAAGLPTPGVPFTISAFFAPSRLAHAGCTAPASSPSSPLTPPPSATTRAGDDVSAVDAPLMVSWEMLASLVGVPSTGLFKTLLKLWMVKLDTPASLASSSRVSIGSVDLYGTFSVPPKLCFFFAFSANSGFSLNASSQRCVLFKFLRPNWFWMIPKIIRSMRLRHGEQPRMDVIGYSSQSLARSR